MINAFGTSDTKIKSALYVIRGLGYDVLSIRHYNFAQTDDALS